MYPVGEDPPIFGNEFPRNIRLFVEGRINGALYTPPGDGPHPVVVLCHGFPGHENNMDISHSLVRGGIASAVFHYTGSWGSKGSFTFQGMIDDVKTVYNELRSGHDEYKVDPSRMAIIGHSMGGWASFMAAKDDVGLRNLVFLGGFNLGLMGRYASASAKNRQVVLDTFQDAMPPLNGCTPEGLLAEVLDHVPDYDLDPLADRLSDRSILMVCGEHDITSEPRHHHDPLFKALGISGAKDLTELRLDAPHSFMGRRIVLQRSILDWVWDRIGPDRSF